MSLFTTLLWSNDLRCQPFMTLLGKSPQGVNPSRHCLGAATWDVNLSWHCLAIWPKMSTPYGIAWKKQLQMSNLYDTVWKTSLRCHYTVLPRRMDMRYRRSRYCLGETTRGVACNIVFLFENLFRLVQNRLSLVFSMCMILINAQKEVAVDT